MDQKSLDLNASSCQESRNRKRGKAVLSCLFGIWLVFISPQGFAQATGQVSGVVTDPTGGALSGAKVELTSTATDQARAIDTGRDGGYTFPLVNPGIYQVQVSLTGFRTNLTRDVEVLVNTTTRVDVKLVVGSTSQEVTVTGAVPLVETSNATTGVVIGRESVVDLPLNGRNFAQLGTLIPGVVAAPAGLGGAQGNATPGGFGDTTGSFNVNGQRNQSNNFLLDGAPNNDSFNSGFVFRPPPDAIEEFKILTHSYEAQYGRNSGSVVDVVTRSGTNQFHGSVWEFNREAALAAKTYFVGHTSRKPNYQQNQFGGAVGGPVVRDKLFLFGYYEGFRLKDGTANTLNVTVPTAQERIGNFSDLAGVTLKDPNNSNAQFSYGGVKNAINPARISPIAADILQQYIPLPNQNTFFYGASPANLDNRNQFGFRGDWKLGSKHSILGRYLHAHQNLFGPVTPSNFAPKGNLQLITLQDQLASDTWTINDHIINVARFDRQHIDGQPNATSGLDLSTVGYAFSSTNATAKGLPYVSLTNAFTQGDAQQPFASRKNEVDGLTDDVTWTRGKHVIQFGGEFRRDSIGLLYINRPNGNFTFTGYFTGNSEADFLLGYPQEFQQGSGDPALNGASYTYSVYGQDQFKVNPRLTVELGLRYEVNRPYVEAKNHLAALHPGQQSTIQPTAPTGLVYPGDKDTPSSTYHMDTNNVAPRLGVVFDPYGNGKTSFRAAWGLFFDTVPGQGDFFQNGTLAPPFQPLQEIDFNTFTSAPTSTYFASPYNGIAAGPVGFPPGLTFIGWSLPHSFQTPRVQQYNFGVQHELTNNMGFEIDYVGSRGQFLPIFIEVNPTNYVATGNTTAGANAYKSTTRAVFPAFGLTRPTFSASKSWYDSLQASWQIRNYRGLHATAAYTWSHSLDDVSGLNIGGDSRPILPVTIGNQASIDTALTHEKGNSLYDARNRFVLSLGYELPKLNGSSLVDRYVLGGWQFNTIFQAQSGNPFTVVNSSTSAQSLTFRPNLVSAPNTGAPRRVGTISSERYFNIGAFSDPQQGNLIDNSHSGNEPRNVVLGSPFNSTDVSLFKNFPIRESGKIELRLEAFNVFNEAHFSQPVATYNPASLGTFGQVTSTVGNDSRVLQFAFKIEF